MSLSRSRKPKVKWTNQMNNDVLECKRRAQELVASGARHFGISASQRELWPGTLPKELGGVLLKIHPFSGKAKCRSYIILI